MTVYHAAEEGFDGYCRKGADANADECEAGFSDGPTADSTEDDRVGDEAEIENCVDDGNVEVPEYAVWGRVLLVGLFCCVRDS